MSLQRRSTPRRPAVALTVAAVAAALLSACAQGGGSGTATAAAGDRAGSVTKAKEQLAAWSKPITTWPEEPKLTKTPDIKGKKITVVALGDQIPVIHGVAVGIDQAMAKAGATTQICDGKFNPTAIADCLKTAGDQGVDAVVTLFIDYAMVPSAFDVLANTGTKVLVGGVAPSGGRQSDDALAFYDNTERVNKLYEAMSISAVANGGENTNALWVRLKDSTTTTKASDRGVDAFKQTCPSCGLATADFTTANVDKLPSAVSAALVSSRDTTMVIVPVDSFVPPALQGIKSAGFGSKVKVVSSSSDLAGLQRVKDGEQISDLGTPVLYEGWKYANALMQHLAGDEVRPATVLVTRDFNPQNIGEMELTPDAYLSNDWFGDNGYERVFLDAWGVK